MNRFGFFLFATVVLTLAFFSHKAVADSSDLTEAEVKNFLKVSLFEPRVEQFIENTLAHNRDLVQKISNKKLAELKTQWRQKLVAEYQMMTRETFNREELQNLSEYFVSPVCLKWQVFSDTAYSNGRKIVLKDLNSHISNSNNKKK